MAKSNDVSMGSASRGTKTIRSTGQDTSSYGQTGTQGIKNTTSKGGVLDISSSISNGQVRKIP